MKLPFPLEPGEQLLLCEKRHWIALWPRFLALLVTAAVPSGFALGLLERSGNRDPGAWKLALAAAALWSGFWLSRAVLHRRRYERSLYALTDTRVVTVLPAGALGFAVSSMELEEVRDVRTRVDGALAMLLRFGEVQFGSGDGGVATPIEKIARPHEVALELQQAARAARASRRSRWRSGTQQFSAGWAPPADDDDRLDG